MKKGDVVRVRHSSMVGIVTGTRNILTSKLIEVDGVFRDVSFYIPWVPTTGEPVWFWGEEEFNIVGCFPRFGYYGVTSYEGMNIIKPFFGKDPIDMFIK